MELENKKPAKLLALIFAQLSVGRNRMHLEIKEKIEYSTLQTN